MIARREVRAALPLCTLALLAACTPRPTPYQPLAEQGGYQETRLEARVYRVTFQGNPQTGQGAVLDMALLRCAELARQAGLTHLVLLGRSAEAKLDTFQRSADGPMGFGHRRFFGFPQYETVTYVRYHAVTVLVRLLPAEEAKGEKDALDAGELLKNLSHYRQAEAPR